MSRKTLALPQVAKPDRFVAFDDVCEMLAATEIRIKAWMCQREIWDLVSATGKWKNSPALRKRVLHDSSQRAICPYSVPEGVPRGCTPGHHIDGEISFSQRGDDDIQPSQTTGVAIRPFGHAPSRLGARGPVIGIEIQKQDNRTVRVEKRTRCRSLISVNTMQAFDPQRAP